MPYFRAMLLSLVALAVPFGAYCLHATAAEITVLPESPKDLPVILVSGELSDGDDRVFAKVALQLDSALVVFDSPGGSLLAGIGMGKAIRLKEFLTAVSDVGSCQSACGLAWLGGIKRFAHPNSRIGFHAAYVEREGRPSESGAGNALVGAYLNQLGLPVSAIVYLTSAPPEGMQWLPVSEARAHGIDVEIISSDDAPKSVRDSNDGQPQLTQDMKLVDGYDILGYDLQGMPVRQVSLEECRRSCQENTGCKAFTYNAKRKACFLKDGGSKAVANAVAVSGYKAELQGSIAISSMTILEGADIPGHDYQRLSTSDFQICLSACEAETRCAAFTFVKRQSICWLKTQAGAEQPNKRALSGIKQRQ